MAVGTDFNRKLLVTQDWFYSKIYRKLVRQFYQNLGMFVPEEIETLFKHHDQIAVATFRGFDEPWKAGGGRKHTKEQVTQTLEEQNPQGEEVETLQILDEPEVVYMAGLYKKKIEKNKDPAVMKSLHKKAVYTAKVLTMEMIEGQAPICYLVMKHDSITKENIKNLLYRCEKLYQVRVVSH